MKARRKLNPTRPKAERPAWLDDKRQLMRRLPAFQALELCGAITREHRETGDQFASRYRLAIEHAPSTVARYGGGTGGSEVDEHAQAAARRDVARALRLAGPARWLLEALARDERPQLTEVHVSALREALTTIARHG